MAFVEFWKGIAANYSAETHAEGIYQCSDTGDTYIFGVLNSGSGGGNDFNQVDPTLPSPYISEEDSSINKGTYVVKVDDVTPDQYILKIAGKTAKTSTDGIFTLTISERQELSGTGIMYKPIQLMIMKDGKYSMPSVFQYGGGNIEYPELVQDIDPSIVLANIPEGICIIDGSGNIIPAANYSEWNESRGLTGIGINYQGHKLVFGVADSLSRINVDNMTINSLKTWSQALSDVNIPGLAETSSSATALQDFNSKANTDAILEALAISSNPSETNNAAVVCRNYEAGIIGKGLWDLPAAGTLNILRDLRTDLDTLIRVNMGKSYYYIFNDEISVSYSYTSTEYDTANVWYIGIDSEVDAFAITKVSKAEGSCIVIPVYTIE